MSVLEQIILDKQVELDSRRRRRPLATVRAAAEMRAPRRDFATALKRPGLSVIAEIKRRSPAKGDLRVDLDPASLARTYEQSGASALSVLTDELHFKGSDDDLLAARASVSLPVLRKDFTIDTYQLYEGCALGADAVLLITRALTDELLMELLSLAGELRVAALVEVHDAPEVERAVRAGATLIGVNNRNLDTLEVDPETSFRLQPMLPPDSLCISESGIASPELAGRLAGAGYDGILVGEALVRASDPAAVLRGLASAGNLLRASS